MQAVVIILLVIPIAPVLAIGSPAINATCAKLPPSPGEYCLGFLAGEPAAMAATDTRGVAAAAMNTTARKAASMLRVLADLVDELTTCRGYYTTMVESLAGVLVDLGAGQFDAALEKANKAGHQPMECDTLLVHANANKNPFSNENGENDRLATSSCRSNQILATEQAYIG